MLSDTVGFVRDLPHELVAAFRSTLSEAREADLLLHVIDAADPLREDRIAQVDSVLQEIGAGDIPQVLVYNKIDRIEDARPRHDQPNEGRERVWLSARDDLGLDLLEDALTQRLSLVRVQGALHLPAAHSERLRSRLHGLGAVRARNPRRTRLAHRRGPVPGRRAAPCGAGWRRTAGGASAGSRSRGMDGVGWALAHHGHVGQPTPQFDWNGRVVCSLKAIGNLSMAMVGQGPPCGCLPAPSTLSSRIRPATAPAPAPIINVE